MQTEYFRAEMQNKGYKDTRDNAVELYSLIGEKYFNIILSSAFDFSCMYALYYGIEKHSPVFQAEAKKHSDIFVSEALALFNKNSEAKFEDLIDRIDKGDLGHLLDIVERDLKRNRPNNVNRVKEQLAGRN